MEQLFGVSLPVFIGLTLVVFGGCAFMSGQALAKGWRPVYLVFVYGALLGLGDRFLAFALFHDKLLTLSGYLLNTVVLCGICYLSFRLTQARRMVTQYPWLYVRNGPFGWRQRPIPLA
ncbi:MAG: hypothetical protein GC191_11145 [Azospirillum sp.]|nr:hypothetical protein [Azospirillum sp.]